MRIFLAGATGVVGRRLVPLLLAQGFQVIGLTRLDASAATLRAQGVEAVVADVYDPAGLTRAMLAAAPDVVRHQLTDLRDGDSEANARIRTTGSHNLVRAALDAGVRRIVAQSVAWAYEAGDAPAVEETPLDLAAAAPRATTVLGVAALEEAVRQIPEWVVLRYGMFYGPGTWFDRGSQMARKAHAGELVADADVTSFVHVDDAAAAAVAALSWPSGAVNVCDDEPAAGHAWAPAFCEFVDAPPPRLVREERRGWARGADNRHVRQDLGWTPKYASWRDGFVRA